MCYTIPLEVLWGYNCLWLPFGHTLKYNVEKPKLYYSEHNLHVHNVAYHHQQDKERSIRYAERISIARSIGYNWWWTFVLAKRWRGNDISPFGPFVDTFFVMSVVLCRFLLDSIIGLDNPFQDVILSRTWSDDGG